MITITSATRKGGSSKTTLTFSLGGTLAKMGHRVLLLDADSQANLTQGFFGNRVIDPERSMAAVWSGEPLPETVIHETGVQGVWLVPGHDDATWANMIPPEEWGGRTEALRGLLAEVREDFDYAIIDTPPNLHLVTHAAMVAADEVIIPVQAEDPGSRGMVPVMREVRSVFEKWGNPTILGQLLVMVDRRLAIHQTYEAMLRDLYGDLVFTSVIPYASPIKEAFSSRMPISHHKPRSAAAKAFASLADEVEQRIGGRHGEVSAA